MNHIYDWVIVTVINGKVDHFIIQADYIDTVGQILREDYSEIEKFVIMISRQGFPH